MHWYDDMPHIGYNMDGQKVFRPAKGDELDKFLATVDDPDSWFVLHTLVDAPPKVSQDNCLRQNVANGQAPFT